MLASYEYLMDNMGNIETLTQEDGFEWAYGYDGRYRLTSATLSDGTRTRWAEAYAYDDGDNLTQRTRPWSDTFNDGTLDGWSVQSGFLEIADSECVRI